MRRKLRAMKIHSVQRAGGKFCFAPYCIFQSYYSHFIIVNKCWRRIVQYVSGEIAKQAVAALEGHTLLGRKCHVRMDRAGSDTPFAMYVGNIPWSATEADMMQLFAAFRPASCHVLTNMYGRSRGFAIVKFYEEEQMQAAIHTMNGTTLMDRPIECRVDRGPGRSEEDRLGRTEVFVGRLGATVDDGALKEMFSRFGAISSATISRYSDGNSRGWG